jgi:threonine aldolase
VGDDVYGEDPTVNLLEARVAELLGHEAAVFTPTGSLANQLGLRLHVSPGEELVCDEDAHVVRAELGAAAAFSGITTRTWRALRGQLDAAALEAIGAMVRPDAGAYQVSTAAIAVENTHNFAGGAVLPVDDLRALRNWADGTGCTVHLDGARIWNAHVATGTPLADFGAIADTMSVCLSKGLGAPVGSLVLGSTEVIEQARVRRKRMGGGMRQVGVLAAAGLHALDHHVERMAEDHEHARLIAEACGVDPATVPTNIVVVDVPSAPDVVSAAAEQGVRIGAVGPQRVRLLTHLDVSRDDAEQAAKVLGSILGD